MIEEQACREAIFKDLLTKQKRGRKCGGGGGLDTAKFLIAKLEMSLQNFRYWSKMVTIGLVAVETYLVDLLQVVNHFFNHCFTLLVEVFANIHRADYLRESSWVQGGAFVRLFKSGQAHLRILTFGLPDTCQPPWRY